MSITNSQYDWIMRGYQERQFKSHYDLENKLVEVHIDVKGQDVFAKKNARTFEEAVDELYDVLKRQLVKVKEKREN